MKNKKKPYDMKSPQAKALIDEIVHGTFVREGTMVAFPTCFPGVSIPIVGDESHITALDVTLDGIVYGGTSGGLTHLFVGMFHGVTGVVFDMGTVDGADHCAAICCGKAKFVAGVNGPGGGRIIARELQNLPFSLIQEWRFPREPFQDLGQVVEGERIVHAVADWAKRYAVGATEGHLFVVDMEAAEIRIVGEVRGSGRLALGSRGGIFGLDEGGFLWRYDVTSPKKIERKVTRLPESMGSATTLMWARNGRSGLLYTADSEGNLFSFSEEEGFSSPLGRTPLAPVGPMAVSLDGRLFGTCGAELSKLFCYHPAQGEVTNLGVAVSVIERRRYGYTFGDAVVGRDGEIIFGEDDDLGHLWLYFPKIQSPT